HQSAPTFRRASRRCRNQTSPARAAPSLRRVVPAFRIVPLDVSHSSAPYKTNLVITVPAGHETANVAFAVALETNPAVVRREHVACKHAKGLGGGRSAPCSEPQPPVDDRDLQLARDLLACVATCILGERRPGCHRFEAEQGRRRSLLDA